MLDMTDQVRDGKDYFYSGKANPLLYSKASNKCALPLLGFDKVNGRERQRRGNAGMTGCDGGKRSLSASGEWGQCSVRAEPRTPLLAN